MAFQTGKDGRSGPPIFNICITKAFQEVLLFIVDMDWREDHDESGHPDGEEERVHKKTT